MIKQSELRVRCGFAPVTNKNEIVQAGWGYEYDVYGYGDSEADMSVRPEWIGKKVADCGTALPGFWKPILNWDI